jgi:hypothetical protein
VTVVAAAAILVARAPDRLTHPQLYAEDGTRFFLEAEVLGISAVVQPLSYFMLLPRVVALVASWLDPAAAPAIYAWASLVVALLVIARLFSPRLELPFKPALALAIAAVPYGAAVLLVNTNSQWYLSLLLVQQLLMAEATTRSQRIGDAAVVTVAGLTGPFSLVLLPCFVLRSALRRGRDAVFIALLVASMAAVQAAPMLVRAGKPDALSVSAPRVDPLNDFRLQSASPSSPFGGWANTVTVIARLLVFETFCGHSLPFGRSRWPYAAIGGAFLAGLFVLGARAGSLRRSKLLLWSALMVFLASALLRARIDVFDPFGRTHARYFFVPQLVLVWLVLLEAAGAKHGAFCKAMVAALLTIGVVANFPDGFRRPPYADLRWEDYTQRLRDGAAVDVPINPPGWTIHYPGRSAVQQR